MPIQPQSTEWWRNAVLAAAPLNAELRSKAAAVRDSQFGKHVFVRGVVEVSNICRQNCNYCGIRRDNDDLRRRRLKRDVLRRVIFDELPSTITDINFQGGEDPHTLDLILPLVHELKHTRLGVSVGLGTLNFQAYDALREAGASFYVLKIETCDENLYSRINAPGTLQQRIAALQHLTRTGWDVSSGFILGLPGESVDHTVHNLAYLNDLTLAGWSVSPFIPGNHTPYSDQPSGSLEMTLNCVATMRLAQPQRIIPAVSAMNLVGQNGYSQALRAGANLVTVNLTPDEWNGEYPIYTRHRYIMREKAALEAIEQVGLQPNPMSIRDHLHNSRCQRAPPATPLMGKLET